MLFWYDCRMPTTQPAIRESSSPRPASDRRLPRWLNRELIIAAIAVAAIALHLALRWGARPTGAPYGIAWQDWPLIAALVLGGVPLVVDLARSLLRLEFSSDLLAGISIVTSVFLEEYLADSPEHRQDGGRDRGGIPREGLSVESAHRSRFREVFNCAESTTSYFLFVPPHF